MRIERSPGLWRSGGIPLGGALWCVVLAAWAGAVPAHAVLTDGIYRLTTAATCANGCVGACDCATVIDTLRGTFRLRYTGSDPLNDYYAVSDVYLASAPGGTEQRFVGSGTYQVGGDFALVQRMQLDLWINGAPPTHFDSGSVPVSNPPKDGLDVTVSITGAICYDTILDLVAVPVPQTEILPYTLGGASQYQEGCWPPCDCILYDPQPATGTFGLVLLDSTPLYTEYAVVDVDWWVSGRVPAQGDPHVTGGGRYRVGGEVAVMQQITLDLSFGTSAPVHFDSGWGVGGGAFPALDVVVDVNGMQCFDQVFYVHAQPTIPPQDGDLNCDGHVNFNDINPFVVALVDRSAYESQYAGCRWLNADCNGDGRVDFRDINPFVVLLAGH